MISFKFFLFFEKSHSRRGMTLIEILLVTALISLVTLAIYQSLSLGIKVWERSRGAVIEQDIVLVFEKLTQDLHNAVIYSVLPPEGDVNGLRIPTIVADPDENFEDGKGVVAAYRIAYVGYQYDAFQKVFIREEQNYSQALADRSGERQVLLENIRGLQFKYFYITDGGEVITDHLAQVLPAMIEIKVIFADPLGERSLTKLIDIPMNW